MPYKLFCNGVNVRKLRGPIKKKLLSSLILAGSMLSAAIHAEGGMIGTDLYGLFNDAPNVFYQRDLGDKAAWWVALGAVSRSLLSTSARAQQISGAYKVYIKDNVDGLFWQVGTVFAIGSVTISGSTYSFTSFGGFGGIGYEVPATKKIILGGSVNLAIGTTRITGRGSGSGTGSFSRLFVAYQF